jgi:hypothetical protein
MSRKSIRASFFEGIGERLGEASSMLRKPSIKRASMSVADTRASMSVADTPTAEGSLSLARAAGGDGGWGPPMRYARRCPP